MWFNSSRLSLSTWLSEFSQKPAICMFRESKMLLTYCIDVMSLLLVQTHQVLPLVASVIEVNKRLIPTQVHLRLILWLRDYQLISPLLHHFTLIISNQVNLDYFTLLFGFVLCQFTQVNLADSGCLDKAAFMATLQILFPPAFLLMMLCCLWHRIVMGGRIAKVLFSITCQVGLRYFNLRSVSRAKSFLKDVIPSIGHVALTVCADVELLTLFIWLLTLHF